MIVRICLASHRTMKSQTSTGAETDLKVLLRLSGYLYAVKGLVPASSYLVCLHFKQCAQITWEIVFLENCYVTTTHMHWLSAKG